MSRMKIGGGEWDLPVLVMNLQYKSDLILTSSFSGGHWGWSAFSMGSSILARLSELEEEFGSHLSREKERELEERRNYFRQCLPVYERRSKLVNGLEFPSKAELEGCDFAVPHFDHESKGSLVSSFWATVLKNEDAIGEFITEKDLIVLDYLEDIQLLQKPSVDGVALHFRENPFFWNKELKRVVGWEETNRGTLPLDEGTRIDWKQNQPPIIEESSSSAESPDQGQLSTTFFDFFSSAVAFPSSRDTGKSSYSEKCNHHEQTDDVDVQKFERDDLILRCIRDRVIPKALHIYNTGSLQTSKFGDAADGLPHSDSTSLEVHCRLFAIKAGQMLLDKLHKDYEKEIVGIQQEKQCRLHDMASSRGALLTTVSGDDLQIPSFWTRALQALSLGPVAVHSRDVKALSFLRNIRYVWTPVTGDCQDEFEFLPNPFFENQVLKREFVFSGRIPESLSASPVSEQGTELVWKPGMDLTRRPSPVKQIPGEGKPAASFFCLFSPGGARLTFNVVGHGKDSEREAKELELEFFQQVKDELVVHPAALYAETGSEFSANDFSASDEGSESAAKEDQDIPTPETTTAGHQNWYRLQLTNQNILMGALVLMVIAEVVFFWGNIANAGLF